MTAVVRRRNHDASRGPAPHGSANRRMESFMKRCEVILSVCMLTLAPAGAAELPRAAPEAVGLAGKKLDAITPALRRLVDEGKLAGGVGLVIRHGKVAYEDAFGDRDLASGTPMTTDTIFAIASMTKPVTCVALMTLVEEGKIALDEPVGKYLPELRDLQVLGDARNDEGDTVATVPARRPVTIRHLLSHRSGIAYGGILSTYLVTGSSTVAQ
jgi:CubicO group peptidase (beta-lactamase class C family)